MLAAMRLQLEFITAQLSSPPPIVSQALGRLLTLVQEALQEVRGISKSLASPGMAAALARIRPATTMGPQRDRRAVSGRICVSNRCRTRRTGSQNPPLSRSTGGAVEPRSATPGPVTSDLRLEVGDGNSVLRIHDDGVGFDVERHFAASAAIASGIGIRSIRDQAESIGGKLIVKSGPPGTTLEVTAPFRKVR